LGTFEVIARAVDNRGATAVSIPVSINVIAANQAPTVSILRPASGTNVARPSTVQAEASATDPDGTIARVEFLIGTNVVFIATNAPYVYSFSTTNTPLGTFEIVARAVDDRGAVSSSAPVTLTITAAPNQPPTVSILRPASGAVLVRPATGQIEASATDSDGVIARIEFLAGTNVVFVATNAPFVYSIETASVSLGALEITARAVDNGGAVVSSTPVTITILAELRVQSASIKANGAFEFVLAAPVGTIFTVETSVDLVTWSVAGNVTATAEGARFAETPTGDSPRKFYRVRAGL
jgi:hypothetical protein